MLKMLLASALASAFVLAGCASGQPRGCAQPPKDGWPVMPEHFYDHELHLVPNFTQKTMTGYFVAFVKPESAYAKMGLSYGDEITKIDGQAPSVQTLSKIKTRQFTEMQVQRCLVVVP